MDAMKFCRLAPGAWAGRLSRRLSLRLRELPAWRRCARPALWFALALFGALPLAAHAQVLVRFADGQGISRDELAAYLAGRADLRGAARDYWGAEAVLREMAMTAVLGREGERLGLARDAGRERGRFDDIYAQAVQSRLMPACERPADETAARQFFEANPQAFVVPPSARLTRLMLPETARVDGKAAADWLAAQAVALGAGQASLDEVAARAAALYPEQPQGDMGWVRLEGDDAVIKRLAAAPQGEWVGPLGSGNFVYLYRLESKREGRPMRWEEVQASAATRAVTYCRAQADAALRQQLFAKYGVQVDEQAVKAMFEAAPPGQGKQP